MMVPTKLGHSEYLFCSQNWTKVTFGVLASKPVARTNHSACCISGRLNGTSAAVLISGGRRPNDVVLEDFWIVDVEEQKWRQVTDLASYPGSPPPFCSVHAKGKGGGEPCSCANADDAFEFRSPLAGKHMQG